MKILFLCLLIVYPMTHAQTFREKIKAKVKEKVLKNLEERPAPLTNADASSDLSRPGDYILSFDHSGLTRYYLIHVPKNYNHSKPTPLIVAMHGGGGDMNYQADDNKYKIISKSEEAGFIVLFPNGDSRFKSGKLATWNAGNCCGKSRDKNIDDVGFIREAINKTQKQLNINTEKIFATGMSNGAMMSYRLACEMSDVFKAIAPVAGSDETINCKPLKPVSLLHIHALDDDHILFNGGAGTEASDKSLVTDFKSIPATISKWFIQNGCTGEAKRVLEVKGAYCELYSQCKNGTEIKLCVTEAGGHSWPGEGKPRKGRNSKALSANDLMWEFFKDK